MKSFRDFELALSHWKEEGGAMIYECGNGSKYFPATWHVDEYGDYIKDLGLSDDDAKQATIDALQAGDLPDEEIATLMLDWQTVDAGWQDSSN